LAFFFEEINALKRPEIATSSKEMKANYLLSTEIKSKTFRDEVYH
jgi:hypothetical protein